MLIPRIITAVVLLAIVAILLVLDKQIYFVTFVSLASALALFEWLRIALNTQHKNLLAAGIACLSFAAFMGICFLLLPSEGGNLIVLTLTVPTEYPANPWAVVVYSAFIMWTFFICFTWVFLVPIVLYQAETDVPENSVFHSIFAVFAVFVAWFSIVICYTSLGAWFLLSFLIVIWCADIFAYFGGRYFGGSKLAPAISPGKTRSGAICGIASVVLWMLISSFIQGSFASLLVKEIGLLGTMGVGIVMAVVSIFGDLYESLLKRRVGYKDSSKLLPGHGGVWDRLDSVLSVSPIAMVFVFLLYLQ